ncbi:MAG TPA: NAD(P)/FAD-dependent oxidoreductase [Saprospiraceae bacterium]|nr:NAD(P)/FAD-dependent oxidoreductase [Saprospiraceae bacterium]
MKINIPETGQERVVIIGAGFAGLELARQLSKSDFQIVLIDKNNYHQFQPLFYQVAMAGLEPSSIVFPIRKYFRKRKNVFFRVTEVKAIEADRKRIQTPLGIVNYDRLVIATGADTNFFGNIKMADLAIPMKSVSEALYLRNRILSDLEKALSIVDFEERQAYIDIVIVGGGPTGVEVAGALAEMRNYVLPKEYVELNAKEMDIYLVQSGDSLLKGMSEAASKKALDFLKKLGVKIILGDRVVDYDGEQVYLKSGDRIQSHKVIWAAGVMGNGIPGLPERSIAHGNRIRVDRHCQVIGAEGICAIGDIAAMETPTYPQAHPQVAQVAMQQARYLARFLRKRADQAFEYKDLGAMATIGRNKAVVDLPRVKFQGAFAWLIWLFVHLYQLLGVKNKLFVFINWVWNYLTYDQSLRLIIRPYPGKKNRDAN